MGYLSHEGMYAVYNVNKRIIVKKQDIIFFEHILGHPSIEGWGLAPSWNIVGERVEIVDLEVPDLVKDEGDGEELHVAGLRPSEEDNLAMMMATMDLETMMRVKKLIGR